METYIAILRGINVSGHNLIKMKSLQKMFESLGFSGVKTYIQSGNVVFFSKHAEKEKLEGIISAGIQQNFGYTVPVIVLSKEELADIQANNIYAHERGEEITKLHATILNCEPLKDLTGLINGSDYLPDEFYLSGKTVYLFCPNGYGNTKLSNSFLEKKLKVQATTRNWKTILELIKMTE